jgi:hypothetical protein
MFDSRSPNFIYITISGSNPKKYEPLETVIFPIGRNKRDIVEKRLRYLYSLFRD